MDARHTLKCDIYKFRRLRIDVIDTLRFNNDADFLYRLATALGMRLNREYWWSTKQPQVTDLLWQLGFQWHRRGIELVFKSLDCFTKPLFRTATIFCCYICICCLKLHQADYKVEDCFFWVFYLDLGGGGGSTQLKCIYYLRRILISRPPRVFWHFKRRSCSFWYRNRNILGEESQHHCYWSLATLRHQVMVK